MGARRRDIRATRLGRFVRGRRPDRNSLRRGSDRVETAVLALLVIVFLAAAPFAALASGSWALARAHQIQLAERASSYQVSAVVLKLDAPSGEAYGDPGAQARWTAHDGKVVTGEIPVPLGMTVGATQWLWTSADGQLTNPPLQDSQVTGQAHVAEGLGVVTLAVLLTAAGLVTRWTLDKRRLAAWDAEWRVTGPRWTTRA
ncbi:MAG: Rv1733c family protein [Streptosporangiaceae bacterium]